MPSSLQARITRSAISPRLAMRTFLNTWGCISPQRTAECEKSNRLISRLAEGVAAVLEGEGDPGVGEVGGVDGQDHLERPDRLLVVDRRRRARLDRADQILGDPLRRVLGFPRLAHRQSGKGLPRDAGLARRPERIRE